MPSDRQRDYVDAVEEWRRQQDEGGWRVISSPGAAVRTKVRDLTPEEREALTVPAGALDHYRQDPSDPTTLDTEMLMVRVAEGRISPRDASAIVARDVAVAKRGWEAFYALLAAHSMIVAMNANNPWVVRLFMAGAVCACVARVYQFRRSRRSLEE